MSKLPKTVNILGVKFKVSEVPVVNKDTPEKGEINFFRCEILIDDSMPEDLKMQTLWHEILHAVCDLTGNYETGENENAIQGIATGIYCVLKDNKEDKEDE